jgi:hypothetical protein
MVMIAFVGVATFDKPGTGATSILQAVIWVSPKRQLRNATLDPCCSYYSYCAAVRGAAVGALGSQLVVMTYRIPRHIGRSAHHSKDLGEEPLCSVEWSRGGKSIATLALQVVVLGLLQPPAYIEQCPSEVAQKAYKAQ